ncbi:MAG: hypothetical protein QM706_15390 [Nitrospira sp.]
MLKRLSFNIIPLFCVALIGCTIFSKAALPVDVHDIHVNGQRSITPLELHAVVGEEIRWHNDLAKPIYLGILNSQPIQQVGCDKGFTTWYGTMKEMVTIPAGSYVSLCFSNRKTFTTISGRILQTLSIR